MSFAIYRELSKEPKNGINIYVGQAVLEILIQNIILTVLIHNLNTA